LRNQDIGLLVEKAPKITKQIAEEVLNIIAKDSDGWRSAWKIHFRMLQIRYWIDNLQDSLYAYNGGQEILKTPLSKRWKENKEYTPKVMLYATNLWIIKEHIPDITNANRVQIAKSYGHERWKITYDFIKKYNSTKNIVASN